MRKSDLVTIFRILLVFASLILLYFNNLVGLLLIPFLFFLDSVDGFVARREKEKEYGKGWMLLVIG
jgi:phosphatidylglycerophosphate synthase